MTGPDHELRFIALTYLAAVVAVLVIVLRHA